MGIFASFFVIFFFEIILIYVTVVTVFKNKLNMYRINNLLIKFIIIPSLWTLENLGLSHKFEVLGF